MNAFFFQLACTASIEPLHALLEERFVARNGGELSTPADHQRLPESQLEAMVSLLGNPVLMRTAGMDPRGAKAVVAEQRREALGECAASAALQLMGRCLAIVAADHFR